MILLISLTIPQFNFAFSPILFIYVLLKDNIRSSDYTESFDKFINDVSKARC
jgi:hypothetical protein